MASTKWTCSGTKILMNGQPVQLKGVCYAPTTKGYSDGTPQIGDWFYDQVGCLWATANPSNDRGDLATMQKLGINHLRTYFWWHWQWPQDGTTWILNRGWKNENAAKFNHTRFLNECLDKGIYVMMGLAVDKGNVYYNTNQPQFKQFYIDTATALGQQYGAHPAVMGLVVGNETNDPNLCQNTSYWQITKEMASAFKAAAPDKLTMIAFQNDTSLFSYSAGGQTVPQILKNTVDVIGLNIYSGMDTTLSNYQNKVANTANAMPLIVSEWGVGGGKNVENPKFSDPSYNFPKTRLSPNGDKIPIGPLEGPPYGIALTEEFNADDFAKACAELKKLVGIMKQYDFVAGCEYFEWNDEYWKNKTDPAILQRIQSGQLPLDQWGRFLYPGSRNDYRIPTYPDVQEGSSDPNWPEEAWGLYGIESRGVNWNEDGYMYNPDALKERPTVQALKEAYAGW